ncbi:hypothetical protein ACFX1S_041221 [Malus domestica]
MRKLLEFDFSVALDGAIKGRAAKIGATEDEVSDERTVECKVAAAPDHLLLSWSSSIRSFKLCGLLALENLPRWVSGSN